MAYDSGYDDDEDGWSVVGEVGRFGLQTEQTGLGYGLDGGHFAVLAVSGAMDSVANEKFYECDCDNADFRFVLKDDRRARQQVRRKQNGQQRKGRTARKRVAAANKAVVSNMVMRNQAAQKRQSWLSAKLLRTMMLWRAAIAEAKACYVYQDDWRQLEEQMRQHLYQDKRFWNGAINDLRSGGVMVCLGEKERLSNSMAQIELFRRVAVDGKSTRFEQYAGRCAEECDAGAGPAARSREALQDVQHDQQRRCEQRSTERMRLEATERLNAHLNEEFRSMCGLLGVQLVTGRLYIIMLQ